MIEHSKFRNLLQFETLNQQESLFNFTTTISGGVSNGNYSSFNLGMYGDDTIENITQNRKILINMLDISLSDLYVPYQTHDDIFCIIDRTFLTKNKATQQRLLHGVDAIITNQPNICIGIGTADCVPILMYDPRNHVLAAIHAGWRGTVAQLPIKVLKCMMHKFGTSPSEVLVGIGPSISQDKFEVGNEVIDAFYKANFDVDYISIKNKNSKKYHIDLWKANTISLERGNIQKNNIEISGLCTYKRNDLFFSARRQTIYSGRMITGGILY